MIRLSPKFFSFFSASRKDSLWGYSKDSTSGPSTNHTTSSFSITLQCNRSQTTYKKEQQAIEDHNRTREDAYREGHVKGYTSGSSVGYGRGYEEGYEDGFVEGKNKGYWEGARTSIIYMSSAFGLYTLFSRLLYGQK